MRFTEFDHYRRTLLVPQGLEASVVAEEQRSGYESGRATIVDPVGRAEIWRLRTAKVTPTKAGAFVAVWRRASEGGTESFPCDEEATSGLLVFVRDGDRCGVFRFTAEHLRELGITSSPEHPGKRGFRVYPSWCVGLNRQAQRTQAAQSRAFMLLESSIAAGS